MPLLQRVKSSLLLNMASYTYIFVLATVINISYCQNCAMESLWPSEIPVEARLKTKLLDCYDFSESPNSNTTNRVEVEVAYIIQMLQFDVHEEVLTIYSWNIFQWDDARLKWDPDDNKGIKSTVLNFYEIWTPELKIKNYEISEPDSLIHIYDCLVNNTGRVKCIQANVHNVMCSNAMRDWPFDRKHCVLKIDDGSWTQSEANIVFTKLRFLSFEGAYTAWRLVYSQEHLNLTGEYQASIEFGLERVAEGLEAAIIVPAFVMSVLTIITFLMDVKGNMRLGILCGSLYSHYLFIAQVNQCIPKQSIDTPKILLFIIGSMTLTLIFTVLALILKYFCSRKFSPPVLITSFNSFVLNSYGEYLVFPRWSGTNTNKTVLDSLSQQTEWFDFLILLTALLSLFVL
ncbi:neuronal acetylcholine receptor subunit alpha-4-like [Leguminivora glycinivorella]|uniref:neuronal acetylcholine receptor subunit alpha-4-like n=1 Tax=Leguminivora glycinivorella TaxID=1035111 RepID=UPI00201043FC|nr:neuronal acetylcholine receptor subunit alpha-4-like [Leguminivora glycinivorella]